MREIHFSERLPRENSRHKKTGTYAKRTGQRSMIRTNYCASRARRIGRTTRDVMRKLPSCLDSNWTLDKDADHVAHSLPI